MEAGTQRLFVICRGCGSGGAREAVIKVSLLGPGEPGFGTEMIFVSDEGGKDVGDPPKHRRECFTASLMSSLPSFGDPKI